MANRTPSYWSGGGRVLPAGLLPPWVALWTAMLLAVVTVAAAWSGLAVWSIGLLLGTAGLEIVAFLWLAFG